MALVESFEVAGVTVRRVPAIVRREPLRVVPNRRGDAFSPIALGLSMIIDYVHGFEMGGILGHNFLRRYRVSIDSPGESCD